MKKFVKTILGVTLLEVMLVLVIASLILVMSIRYYQSATQSSKVDAAMQTLTGIIAAVYSYINAGNPISGVSCSASSCPNLGPYLPNNAAPTSPWGTGNVTVAPGSGNYTVTFESIPGDACVKLKALAAPTGSTRITGGGCPSGTSAGNFVLTIIP